MHSALRILERGASATAALCVVAIMIMISLDVILRYGFNAPLRITFDVVTYYFLVAAIYLALSDAFRNGDHISIDLFQMMMPPRVRTVSKAIIATLALVVFATIAFAAWDNAWSAFQKGQYYPGYMRWPSWLSHLPVALGTVLLCLRLALHVWMLISTGADHAIADGSEAVE